MVERRSPAFRRGSFASVTTSLRFLHPEPGSAEVGQRPGVVHIGSLPVGGITLNEAVLKVGLATAATSITQRSGTSESMAMVICSA
jgi:hypothetical protein